MDVHNTRFSVALYWLHHFEEGLIDLVSLFSLKEGVIVVGERQKLIYYTVSGHQIHPLVSQNCLQSNR